MTVVGKRKELRLISAPWLWSPSVSRTGASQECSYLVVRKNRLESAERIRMSRVGCG